jgi:hypothetical protein
MLYDAAKEIAMSSLLSKHPHMTVGKFLDIYDKAFDNIILEGVDVRSEIYIGFYERNFQNLRTRKDHNMNELHANSLHMSPHAITGYNKEFFYDDLNRFALKNVPDLLSKEIVKIFAFDLGRIVREDIWPVYPPSHRKFCFNLIVR